MAVSLHPRDFVMGGLIDDVDVEITGARFIATDYEGRLDSPTALAMEATMKILGDDSGNEHTQLFSAGNVADFLPNPEDDGRTLIENGTKTSLNKSTNLSLFLASMSDQGADLAPLSAGDIGVLIGAQMHVQRKPGPKRDNLAPQMGRDGKERANMVLVCTKIISLPWDKKGRGTAKGAAKGAAAQAAATANATAAQAPAAAAGEYDEDQLATAVSWITETLAESGPLTMGQLKLRATRNTKVFGFEKPGKEANQFVAHITGEAFLVESGATVADGTVSLG